VSIAPGMVAPRATSPIPHHQHHRHRKARPRNQWL
jgi:hypothetical protein